MLIDVIYKALIILTENRFPDTLLNTINICRDRINLNIVFVLMFNQEVDGKTGLKNMITTK